MSRRKSTEAATENDENTDSQPDHDESTSKKRPIKRARVLAERDNQSLDDDDDDDDLELLPEDDEDSAELLACLKEKSLKNSDAGIVLSIEARHFMCHRFLTVNLNRNINFIHGANGSGKSAILAALQITLGAKARYTHRANKLADFIQHEWLGNAEVSVKLLNTESDGYQYDLYGKSITVKRILSHSGPSTLALISDDGVVISKDRKEASHS
eukprot:10266-Heterococcus_DN1.PRE.2